MYGNNYQSPYTQQAQARLASMEQQYPQYAQQNYPQYQQGYPQPYNQPVQPKNLLSSVAVTSIEEAKAQPIALDGTKQLFMDTSNGKIYTKQFNIQTGGADFDTYEKVITQLDNSAQTDMEKQPISAGSNILEEVKSELDTLRKEVSTLKEELNYVQPNESSTNDVTAESTTTGDDKPSTRNGKSRTKS